MVGGQPVFTLAAAVFFEELNTGSFDGGLNLLSGIFAAAQVAIDSFQTCDRRLGNP